MTSKLPSWHHTLTQIFPQSDLGIIIGWVTKALRCICYGRCRLSLYRENHLCVFQLFFLSAFKRLVWVSHVLNHQRACTVTRNCAAYICNNKLKQIARLYLYLHVVRDSILYWYSRSRFENVYTGLKKTGSDNNTTKCKQNGLRNSPRTWNRTEKDSYVKSKLDSIFVLW